MMKFKFRLPFWPRRADPTPQSPATTESPRQPRKRRPLTGRVNQALRDAATPTLRKDALALEQRPRQELKRAALPPGVVPKLRERAVLAQDATPYDFANGFAFNNTFPGYIYLAELSQIAEYRMMCSKLSEEMTREGIEIVSTDDDDDGNEAQGEDRANRITRLTALVRQHKIMAKFRQALELEGFFGRCQLYIDMRVGKTQALASDDPVELASRLALSPRKVGRNSFVGLRVVEPMWSYPGIYNSTNPLKADYYVPSQWYVMGSLVHASRLLTIISNPVPDLLKAAYSFGGISLAQLAMPYVNNWLRTRQSVSDAIHSFSTSGILTNLQDWLSAPIGGDGVDAPMDPARRAEMFNLHRDNKGCMVLDKDSEEFFQFNMPLSGLDHLQAQSQEHMCSVSALPLVKFTGITPSGLNASSDGEIRVFYDTIAARQERILRDDVKKVLDLLQLSEFGDIDDGIDFRFRPLYQLSEQEEATTRKLEADTDVALITAGVIAPEEARERLANDPDSPYQGLEVDDVPEIDNVDPESEEEEGDAPERADTRSTGAS